MKHYMTYPLYLPLCLALLTFGCSSPDDKQVPTKDMTTADQSKDLAEDMKQNDQSNDMPGDMADDMSPQDMNADMDTGDACKQTISWAAGPALPEAISEHNTFITTVANAAYLHVVGGKRNGPQTTHIFAKINDDGTLASWENGPDVPNGISANVLGTFDDGIFLFSGETQGGPNSNGLRAEFDTTTGKITAWVPAKSLNATRIDGRASIQGDRLYVSGGASFTGSITADIDTAQRQADGTLGEWSTLAMPQARAQHATAIHDNHLYIFLGRTGSIFDSIEAVSTIERADLSKSPLEWTQYAAAPTSLMSHAITTIDQCAYLFGGQIIDNNQAGAANDKVYLYDLSGAADATTTPKTLTGPTTPRFGISQAPYHNGRFYLVGGYDAAKQPQTTVEIGTLSK